MLITMHKSVAPTELKHNALLLFYKGNTPTELSAFLKHYRMDKAIISSDTPTKSFANSKTEISSANAEDNRIWDLFFEIRKVLHNLFICFPT